MDSKNGHKGTKNYSNTWICAIAKIGSYAYFFGQPPYFGGLAA